MERGRILLANKKYAEGVEGVCGGLAVRPDHTDASGPGACVLELNRSAEASKACDRYLEKGPPVARCYRLRGQGPKQGGGGMPERWTITRGSWSPGRMRAHAGQAWLGILRVRGLGPGGRRLSERALRLDRDNEYALNGRARHMLIWSIP